VTLDAFLDMLDGVRQIDPSNYVARCPAHDDRNPSLSISDGEDRILFYCHAGCAQGALMAALKIDWSDTFYDNEFSKTRGEPEAEYFYVDEQGQVLCKICRYPGKVFVPYHPQDGIWVRGLEGVRRVLYRLPEVLAAQSVYIVEGEKDVEALRRAGKVATCNLGGAGKGKWLADYPRCFVGKNVIIVADNDEPGLEHASYVASTLVGIAKSVWIALPAYGKDAADHLAAGLRPGQFVPQRRVA
jgi:DNA primase